MKGETGKSQFRPHRRAVLGAGAASAFLGAGASTWPGAEAAEAACAAVTRAQFDDYIALFNDNDPSFVKYYHPDVVLELGDRQIRTAKGIADFYAEVKAHVKETLEIGHFVSDRTGLAAEIPTEFRCFKDWDNFLGRPIEAGQVFRVVSFVMYRVEDGKFAHIKSARAKLLNDWRFEN